jgi:hypothetical protein
MKPISPQLCACTVLALLALASCDTAAPAFTASTSGIDARGQACVNVRHTGTADLGFPVIIPIDPAEPLIGGGALPAPTSIGPYEGMMSSILTSETPAGRGAVHYTLVHYWTNGTGDAFWTEDRAVCAPVGTDPFSCLVNDRMTIVGGTGVFTNAHGRLHNRGLITITDPTGNPFGSVEVNLNGRVCSDGL